MFRPALFCALCCVAGLSLNAVAEPPAVAAGEITHGPLAEVSGIAKSQTYEDTYWVHNDSGDEARLFAIRADGSVIVPPFLRNVKLGPGDSPELWQGMPI